MLRKIGYALAFAILWTIAASAQTSPGLRQGQVPTAAQWNGYFAAKQDYLGFTPLNTSNFLGTAPISLLTASGVISITCPTCVTGSSTIPSTVQGDTLYASAAGVLSALTKSTGANMFLSNGGTNNNPLWAQPSCASLSDASAFCNGTNAANLTGTVNTARMSGSYTGITGVGTLTAGATGSGFTVALATSTITGALPAGNFPALTGDVTTSAGALATTIANNAVTNAKMATMVTSTVKGNFSGSTTTPSDASVPSCANDGSHALTNNAGGGFNCVVLSSGGTVTSATIAAGAGIGVSGTCTITTSGTCTVAAASGARVLLNTLTASNSASLADTTSLTSTYNRYEIVISSLVMATNATNCRIRYNVGGVQTTGYKSTVNFGQGSSSGSNSSTTFVPCTSTSQTNSSSAPGLDAICSLNDPSGSGAKHMMTCTFTSLDSGGTAAISGTVGGWYDTNGAVTGLEVTSSSGNLTSGTVRIYGIVN